MIILKHLSGKHAEIADLQTALESAPAFSERTTGSPPGPSDAKNTLSILPPGKAYGDKFVFNVYDNSRVVGCVDLIRGYPDDQTAWIGLLLIDERLHGRGLGSSTYLEVERKIKLWVGIERIRLSVVATNDSVLPFWQKMGFVLTGERKPYIQHNVTSEVIIMEKRLT